MGIPLGKSFDLALCRASEQADNPCPMLPSSAPKLS